MKLIYRRLFAAVLLAGFGLAAVRAEGPIELESISIIGNRELPTTITIVPWKKAYPGKTLARPVDSVLNELLQPVDHEVFRRRLDYYRMINPLRIGKTE